MQLVGICGAWVPPPPEQEQETNALKDIQVRHLPLLLFCVSLTTTIPRSYVWHVVIARPSTPFDMLLHALQHPSMHHCAPFHMSRWVATCRHSPLLCVDSIVFIVWGDCEGARFGEGKGTHVGEGESVRMHVGEGEARAVVRVSRSTLG